MAANKPRPTLADYTAVAFSPVLIMALVGSLVFFLLEILYSGDYPGTLQWILFFYIFGAVLVARMSFQFGLESRAPMYGTALAVGRLGRTGAVRRLSVRAGGAQLDHQRRAYRRRLVVLPSLDLGLHLHRREGGDDRHGSAASGGSGEERSARAGETAQKGETNGLVVALSASSRTAQEDQTAGRLGGLLLAGGTADLRTRTIADSGRTRWTIAAIPSG